MAGEKIVHLIGNTPDGRDARAVYKAPSYITDSSVFSVTRSEEHTSELPSLMRISYAVFCLNKKILLYLNTQHLASHSRLIKQSIPCKTISFFVLQSFFL